MINEDYVSFETAKLLKERGFDEKVRGYYSVNSDNNDTPQFGPLYNHNHSIQMISAPTLQMAMKWLREVYQIHIEIGFNEGYFPVCISTLTNDTIPYKAMQGKPFKYEEACEAAIKYCLKNLI